MSEIRTIMISCSTDDYSHGQAMFTCRLRGKLDSNGVAAAYLEERLNMGLNLILSAEIQEMMEEEGFKGICDSCGRGRPPPSVPGSRAGALTIKPEPVPWLLK
ncbi:hypothetical protein QQ045_014593 [Rhodiola kirilowii]